MSARLQYVSRLRQYIKAQGCNGELRDLDGTLAGLQWQPRADQTPAQITTANGLLNTSEATLAAWESQQSRTVANSLLDNNRSAELKVLRGALMAINDALNQTNARLNALLTAIDNNSTLANIKTAVAAIQDLPTRTDAQALQQVKDRITAGTNVD